MLSLALHKTEADFLAVEFAAFFIHILKECIQVFQRFFRFFCLGGHFCFLIFSGQGYCSIKRPIKASGFRPSSHLLQIKNNKEE